MSYLQSSAQWRDIRLKTIGPAEGLTMRVNSISEDSTGYIFFGGTQGLSRYDGVNFKHYVNILGDTNSISPGEVYKTVFDDRGNLWMTIRFSGLNRYNPRTNKFTRFSIPDLGIKTENGCFGLLYDEQGNTWAGGHGLRLFKVDQQADTLITFQPDNLDVEKRTGRLMIIGIIQDNQFPDILWLSVTDFANPHPKSIHGGYALISFNRTTHEFKAYPNIGRLSHQDENGIIHSTHIKNSIILFDPKTEEVKVKSFETSTYPQGLISRSLITYRQKKLLLTAFEIRESNSDGNWKTIFHTKEDDPIMNQFYLDRKNRLWITSEQGVQLYDPSLNQIDFYSLSEHKDLYRIYPGRLSYDEKSNSILLAHHGKIAKNRLYQIPLDRSQPASYLENNFATYGTSEDKRGRNWVSTLDALYILKNGILEKQNIQIDEGGIPWHWNMRTNKNGILGLLPTDRFIWLDTETLKLNSVLRTAIFNNEDIEGSKDNFAGFTFDNNENAVVYSSKVFEINLETSEVITLNYDPVLNPNRDHLSDVRIDNNGFYWISGPSFTGKFEKSGADLKLVKAYTVNDGLAESSVTEMQIDYQNRVWCFTGSGINCIDEKENDIKYYGVLQGLPQIFIDPRKVISLPDNRIATINKNGLIIFHPDSLWNSNSQEQIPVAINQIKINGQVMQNPTSTNFLKEISIPPGNNIVDVQFQGLNFSNTNQINYSYRIIGFQENWVDIGKNASVTLAGLPAGWHTLQLKTGAPSNNNIYKSLKIFVETPFYKKPWFISLVILASIGILFWIYKWKINKIKKEETEKTEINKKIAELELTALRSQMNPHFMFNSLNSIKNYILKSERTIAAEYLSNFSHLIRLILQNSREKSISLNQELESLMLYVELEQLRFDDEFSFNCEIDGDIYLDDVQIPPMILQPYIENAIWHGLMHKKEPGILSLLFKKCEDFICCIIEDNGVGRKKAAELKNKSIRKYKSMGMGITHDRIELVNKFDLVGIKIDVEDLEDTDGLPIGTRVTVKIPSLPMILKEDK